MALKFICPECGGVDLECVTPDIEYAVSAITKIDKDGIDYGDIELTGNTSDPHFQCATCGMQIVDGDGYDILQEDELIGWLLEQPYNKEDESTTPG